jgi:hypothetical protein
MTFARVPILSRWAIIVVSSRKPPLLILLRRLFGFLVFSVEWKMGRRFALTPALPHRNHSFEQEETEETERKHCAILTFSS